MVKNKQQNGFTLVEAVVTTAIVATMSALVLTGMYGAREKLQVRNAANQFASDLRETILMTKNGVNSASCTLPGRVCSNYTIGIKPDSITYFRQVETSSGNFGLKDFPVLSAAKFIDGSGNGTGLDPIKFYFSFPIVEALGTKEFTIVSTSNPYVTYHVCVTTGGVVNVQPDPC